MENNIIRKYPVGTKLKDKFFGDILQVVDHHGSFNIVRNANNLDGNGGIYELDCHMEMFYDVVEG